MKGALRRPSVVLMRLTRRCGGSDECAAFRRLFDRRADLLFGVLRRGWRGSGCEYRAGRDDLDEVGATREELAHALSHLGFVVGDAAPHFIRHERPCGQARDFSAAARDRHVGACDVHARPLDLARVDGVPERDVDEHAVGADVAHRGEAGIERRAGSAWR